ncbi:hypothetical protein [Streptomyces sp. NPDC048496]|uniref:hypothetical protein n=1 Tax=Streptomyces sp. NPDC048496 TaxID=3365558 RepID=UPI003717744D
MSAGESEPGYFRLLPWTGEQGEPCYVLTDGHGQVSRVADTVERVQLGMAEELLGHAVELLADCKAENTELHFLAGLLTESLRDVKRIADSRTHRPSRVEPCAGHGGGHR